MVWNRTSLRRDRDGDVDNLPDYLNSVDLHINLPAGHAVKKIIICSGPPGDPLLFTKGVEDPASGYYTVTVPYYGEPIQVFYNTETSSVVKEFTLHFSPLLGEDFSLEIDDGVLEFKSVEREKTTTIFPTVKQQLIQYGKPDAYANALFVGSPRLVADDADGARQLLEDASELNDWMVSFGATTTSYMPQPYVLDTYMRRFVDPYDYPIYRVSTFGGDPITYVGDLYYLIVVGQ